MKLIPWARPSLNDTDKKFLIKSFDSNWISGGYFVNQLESYNKLHGRSLAFPRTHRIRNKFPFLNPGNFLYQSFGQC